MKKLELLLERIASSIVITLLGVGVWVSILFLCSSCAHTPKPIPGTIEFWEQLFVKTQSDLKECEQDRLQCEVDCDAVIPYSR